MRIIRKLASLDLSAAVADTNFRMRPLVGTSADHEETCWVQILHARKIFKSIKTGLLLLLKMPLEGKVRSKVNSECDGD